MSNDETNRGRMILTIVGGVTLLTGILPFFSGIYGGLSWAFTGSQPFHEPRALFAMGAFLFIVGVVLIALSDVDPEA